MSMYGPYNIIHAGLYGSSSGAFDIESPANRFIEFFTRDRNHVSSLFPRMEVWFQIESKDLQKRTVKMRILGKLISQSFKKVKATFTVTPREDDMGSSSVEWTVQFEKNSHDIEDPERIFDAVGEHIRFISLYLHQLSLNYKVPADKCFKAFIEAFENDDDVEIEVVDWENRTMTMSLRSTHYLRIRFEMLISVTTTITPREDDKGSHMKLDIEAEQISDHIKLEDFITAEYICSTIRNKLRHLNMF